MVAYPITNETNLSIIQTAKLLQALIDVAAGGAESQSSIGGGSTHSTAGDNTTSNTKSKLPESIELCIVKTISVQKELVKEIDQYLHNKVHNVDEIEVVKCIVETCPEFLATKNTHGSLPIHCFAESKIEEAVIEYVPLLAEIGRKHGIGGEEGRGGLLMKNNHRWNALQLLTPQKSSNLMKKLKSFDPPFLLNKDVRNYRLLHKAVRYESIEMVKYMVQLDSSCLYYRHRTDGIPLLQVCRYKDDKQVNEEQKKQRLKMIKYLICEAVSYDTSDTSIGGIFAKDDDDNMILDLMIEKYGPEDAWSCIKQGLLSFTDVPILHKVIQHRPQHFQRAIMQFPNAVLVRDRHNRLPIHVALECGMEWSIELLFMMNANRDNLKDVDPVTKWPPFLLAGLDETASCDHSTVYYLLREHPEQVEIFLNKKRKKCNVEDSDSLTNKRRNTNLDSSFCI